MINFCGVMSVALRLIAMLILLIGNSQNEFEFGFEIAVIIAFSLIFDLTCKRVKDEE